jgi:predicted transposase YbfD/YdcC
MVIIDYIEKIPDPRMSGKVKHALGSIIFTALCGVLSGCESWEDIRSYTKEKQDWLSQFVPFKNGVPSEWTYRRVFTLLSPDHMEHFLRSFAKHILSTHQASPDHIAIDGKTLCGSRDREGFALHSLTAFCHEYGLVIGEESVQERSNEITAIPLLIESLDIKKATLSIDAGGCHKHIAHTIRDKGGNYVLGLKRNHPKLFDAIQTVIKKVGESDENRLHDAFEKRNGRTVRRRYFGFDISSLPESTAWTDLKSVIAVESITSKDNDPDRKVTATWRYYISNHHHLNDKLPGYIRNHWGIENKLHWVLDVQMNEDDDQKMEKKSVRSFALLKRIAINIVNTKKIALQATITKTKKPSLRSMMKRAGWNNDWLLSLLDHL